jgi:hypothetical protein
MNRQLMLREVIADLPSGAGKMEFHFLCATLATVQKSWLWHSIWSCVFDYSHLVGFDSWSIVVMQEGEELFTEIRVCSNHFPGNRQSEAAASPTCVQQLLSKAKSTAAILPNTARINESFRTQHPFSLQKNFKKLKNSIFSNCSGLRCPWHTLLLIIPVIRPLNCGSLHIWVSWRNFPENH